MQSLSRDESPSSIWWRDNDDGDTGHIVTMMSIVAGTHAFLIAAIAAFLLLPVPAIFGAIALSLTVSVSSAAILAAKRGPGWLRDGADIAFAPAALLVMLALEAWKRHIEPVTNRWGVRADTCLVIPMGGAGLGVRCRGARKLTGPM